MEAETQKEANEKALEEAGNYEFNEKESDYALADELSREDRLAALLNDVRNACELAAASPRKGPLKATTDGCLEVFNALVKKIDAAL